MQSQQLPPQRPLSQENIRAYFSPDSKHKLIPVIIFTGIVALICLAFLINRTYVNVFLALLGICLIFIGGCILVIRNDTKKKPTDNEYEKWLRAKINHLYNEKLQMLGIEQQQIVGKVLFFRSYVLPSSQPTQQNPAEKIYLKEGRDGKIRSNITVYTYFIPTKRFIGLIVFDINSLWPEHHNQRYQEYNRPYSYRSIINPTISRAVNQKVLYNGTHCPCQMEKLTVTIRNGTPSKPIDITAIVRATVTVEGKPIRIAPTSDLERQVNLLHQLLIEHE